MKALFISLVVVVFALFLGCENSITDPEVSSNSSSFTPTNLENAANKDYTSTFPGYIELLGKLDDPRGMVNSTVDLKGNIKYKIDVVRAKTAPNIKFAYKVNLKIDALLKASCPGDDDLWKVNYTTVDLVYKTDPQETAYYLDKAFKIKSTCPIPKYLVFRFQVDDKMLKIVSMKLEVRNDWTLAGNSDL